MKNIYSNHIKGQKLTSQKPSIDGVVIHNDYGSMTPSQYLNWLYRREQTGEYVPFYQIIKDKQAKLWWIKFKYAKKGSSDKYFYMPIGHIEDKQEKILNEKHLWGQLEVEKHGK